MVSRSPVTHHPTTPNTSFLSLLPQSRCDTCSWEPCSFSLEQFQGPLSTQSSPEEGGVSQGKRATMEPGSWLLRVGRPAFLRARNSLSWKPRYLHLKPTFVFLGGGRTGGGGDGSRREKQRREVTRWRGRARLGGGDRRTGRQNESQRKRGKSSTTEFRGGSRLDPPRLYCHSLAEQIICPLNLTVFLCKMGYKPSTSKNCWGVSVK